MATYLRVIAALTGERHDSVLGADPAYAVGGLLFLAVLFVVWDTSARRSWPLRLLFCCFLSLPAPIGYGGYALVQSNLERRQAFPSTPLTRVTLSELEKNARLDMFYFELSGPVVCLYPFARPLPQGGFEYPVISRASPLYEECRRGRCPSAAQLQWRVCCKDEVLEKGCVIRDHICCRWGFRPGDRSARRLYEEALPLDPQALFAPANIPYFMVLALIQTIGTASVLNVLRGSRQPARPSDDVVEL